MTWEEYLEEFIHVACDADGTNPHCVWIDHWRLDVNNMYQQDAERLREEVIKRISIVVRKAINEAIYVTPMSDPPMTDEDLDITRGRLEFARGLDYTIDIQRMRKIIELIDWQKAVIAHMAKDNGYNDGVEAGKAALNKENYEWIADIDTEMIAVDERCPVCYKHIRHDEHESECPMANYLQNNKPK